MNIEFETAAIEYFAEVMAGSKMVEETSESIIPDSCPDVMEVLCCGGVAFLRGKEVGDGFITLTAGVSATALVKPEDREMPEVVETYIPITAKMEHSGLKMGQNCVVKAELRRLSGHLVNPRKVMLRATVAFQVKAYEKTQEEYPVDVKDDHIQVLKVGQPLRLLCAMGEKSDALEDEVRLEGMRPLRQLAAVQVALNTLEARLTGTRAVLRGTAKMQILGIGEQGTLEQQNAELPYSQYIDLGECHEEDELILSSCLSGADVSLTSDGSGLNVTLQIETTARAFARREMEYISDIYALGGTVQPEFRTQNYHSLLDRQLLSVVGHARVDGPVQKVIYLDRLEGETSETRNGETVELMVPVTVNALMAGENGDLLGKTGQVELHAGTRAAEECTLEACLTGLSCEGSTMGGDADLKVSGMMDICCYARNQIKMVVGAEYEPEESDNHGPGLIIRKPREKESLWDIAKAYRTTMAAVSAANGLTSDELTGEYLLIPCTNVYGEKKQG